MNLLNKINSFIHTPPKNEDYSSKSLSEMELEWDPFKMTPCQFFDKWGQKLFKSLSDTVDTSLFGMMNREGAEQEANITQVKMVEEVFSICLDRYGYKSVGSLMGDLSGFNKIGVKIKQMFGMKPVSRLDAKEEIIKESVCEFWDGFQRRYYDTYHDMEGYVRPYDAKYVGKLFEYELSGITGWRGF